MNTATPGTPAAAEKPVLLEAIAVTLRALEERSRLYRNLVVAVSLTGVVSFLAALLWRRLWPLAGVLVSVPITGMFLYLDRRQLSRWRQEILGLRERQGLELPVFVDVMTQYKHLPPGTLQAMLALLMPAADGDESETPRRC